MTQEMAESVKDLAKPTVEALGVITERECPECKGIGWLTRGREYATATHKPSCKYCNGTGKLSWKWEPKMFDLYYHDHGNRRILVVNDKTKGTHLSEKNRIERLKCIPILDWETIERVIREAGYRTHLIDDTGFHSHRYIFNVHTMGHSARGESTKSRQQAVMLATIQLGKEKKNVTHSR